MPSPRDPLRTASGAEPTLVVTPAGATPARLAIDPNAPTITPAVAGEPRPAVARPPRVEEAPPPAKIARFTVLRELGRGGTGVVYAAYDEQLDRKVAVKLLHSETREEIARTRLLREAQAMARLSHPNIVGVHEVGTHGRQIYVAMEFVQGMTLHAWLKRQRRSFAEIAEMFRQAGEGLAAAHDAGIIHRDFKPANVMVGEDGRVRVLDFGLARSDAEPGAAPGLDHLSPEPEHTSHVANLRSLDASITVTGVMLGTPAYMSPEQFLGARVDARSDQFSFCVALFEAAYRDRPFLGDTLAELMTAVLAGHVRDVPTPAGVPRAVRPLLLRGLRRDPSERWPSLRPLLAELARFARPPARRAYVAAAGLAATLAGGGVGLAYQTGLVDQACTGGDDQLAAVWSPSTAERLREAAAAAAIPAAPAVYERAIEALGRYGDDWLVGYADACDAPSEALDLRMTCLGERRRALASAVDMLARPDEQIVARALELVSDLPKIDACADEAYLRAKVRPPDDPAVAARVEGLRASLRDVKNLETASKFADALAALEPIAAGAPPDYLPLRAEIALRRGSILENDGRYDESRAAFEDAFFAAVESDHQDVAIDSATRLAYVVYRRLGDKFAAQDWLRHAEIYAGRAGDPLLRARVLTVRGALANFAYMVGRDKSTMPEAIAAFAEARHLFDELAARGTPAPIDRARFLRFHGDHQIGTGDVERGIATEREALALMREALGPQHPDVAMIHNSLGLGLLRAERLDEAAATFREGLAGAVDLPNQRNHIYMTLWSNLGSVLREQGRLDEAEEATRAAIGVIDRSSARLLGDSFTLRTALVDLLHQRGRAAEAEAEATALLARAEQTWGPRDPMLMHVLWSLSRLRHKAGAFAEARAFAERARALCDLPGQEGWRPTADWHLAVALADTGDVPRAVALARAVRRAAASTNATWLAEIDAFLRAHAAKGGAQ